MPEVLRETIVTKILEKSTFSNITGKTIADYSRELECYILTGESPSSPKMKKSDWDQ